jgi:Zn-dependent peptidase ImmA (M78 family)/DNA-binding XRE family transcriptional regulator
MEWNRILPRLMSQKPTRRPPRATTMKETSSPRRFLPGRLQLARALNELTQAELARRVAVTQQFIGYVEIGRKEPSETLVCAFADACGLEPAFFYNHEIDTSVHRSEEWSFRRYQTTSAATIHRLAAHGTMVRILVAHLERMLRLPADDVPALHEATTAGREAVERAAERCRMQWGLGQDLPTKHLTRTLERAGVVVTLVEAKSEKVDGFSTSHGARSIVVIAVDKGSPSRRVFTTAHEAGHLVLHAGDETGTPEHEEQANAFASALVLPRRGFIREFPRPPRSRFWGRGYWSDLFEMKRRWRASASAIVRRAFDLRMIDGVQYQRAYKQMSAHGWTKGEPDHTEPPFETPELLPNAFRALKSKLGVTPLDVAEQLGWKPETLERIAGISIEPPQESEVPRARVIPLALARPDRRRD